MLKISTTENNYMNYMSYIYYKTNVWISYKLRKSKNSNDVTVLLWLRQSRLVIYTLQIGITRFPVLFEASL